jgi:hypothetical protein
MSPARNYRIAMETRVSIGETEAFEMDEFRASTSTIGSRSLLLGKRQRPMPTAAVGARSPGYAAKCPGQP